MGVQDGDIISKMGSCLGKKSVDNSVENDEVTEENHSHQETSDYTIEPESGCIDHQINKSPRGAQTIKYVNPITRSTIICKSDGDVIVDSESSISADDEDMIDYDSTDSSD